MKEIYFKILEEANKKSGGNRYNTFIKKKVGDNKNVCSF